VWAVCEPWVGFLASEAFDAWARFVASIGFVDVVRWCSSVVLAIPAGCNSCARRRLDLRAAVRVVPESKRVSESGTARLSRGAVA
jgi:hypothetical protein